MSCMGLLMKQLSVFVCCMVIIDSVVAKRVLDKEYDSDEYDYSDDYNYHDDNTDEYDNGHKLENIRNSLDEAFSFLTSTERAIPLISTTATTTTTNRNAVKGRSFGFSFTDAISSGRAAISASIDKANPLNWVPATTSEDKKTGGVMGDIFSSGRDIISASIQKVNPLNLITTTKKPSTTKQGDFNYPWEAEAAKGRR